MYEVGQPRARSYGSRKVRLGLSGLVAEFVLLATGIWHRGGLDDPLVLVTLVALAVACAGSVSLLRQGLQESREARLASLRQGHRATDGGNRGENKPLEKPAERQVLEAMERNGEITPARAALQTSLTVDEAEKMLSDLAQRGHIDVRAEGGKLVYAL